MQGQVKKVKKFDKTSHNAYLCITIFYNEPILSLYSQALSIKLLLNQLICINKLNIKQNILPGNNVKYISGNKKKRK